MWLGGHVCLRGCSRDRAVGGSSGVCIVNGRYVPCVAAAETAWLWIVSLAAAPGRPADPRYRINFLLLPGNRSTSTGFGCFFCHSAAPVLRAPCSVLFLLTPESDSARVSDTAEAPQPGTSAPRKPRHSLVTPPAALANTGIPLSTALEKNSPIIHNTIIGP